MFSLRMRLFATLVTSHFADTISLPGIEPARGQRHRNTRPNTGPRAAVRAQLYARGRSVALATSGMAGHSGRARPAAAWCTPAQRRRGSDRSLLPPVRYRTDEVSSETRMPNAASRHADFPTSTNLEVPQARRCFQKLYIRDTGYG